MLGLQKQLLLGVEVKSANDFGFVMAKVSTVNYLRTIGKQFLVEVPGRALPNQMEHRGSGICTRSRRGNQISIGSMKTSLITSTACCAFGLTAESMASELMQ